MHKVVVNFGSESSKTLEDSDPAPSIVVDGVEWEPKKEPDEWKTIIDKKDAAGRSVFKLLKRIAGDTYCARFPVLGLTAYDVSPEKAEVKLQRMVGSFLVACHLRMHKGCSDA